MWTQAFVSTYYTTWVAEGHFLKRLELGLVVVGGTCGRDRAFSLWREKKHIREEHTILQNTHSTVNVICSSIQLCDVLHFGFVHSGSVVWWGKSVVRDELITGPYTGPSLNTYTIQYNTKQYNTIHTPGQRASIPQYRPLATQTSSTPLWENISRWGGIILT